MATLCVENLPDDLYESIRKRARSNRRSISADVLTILEREFPSAEELEKRREFVRWVQELHAKPDTSNRKFPSTEEMQREDRER
jgi:plasmid stability protein